MGINEDNPTYCTTYCARCKKWMHPKCQYLYLKHKSPPIVNDEESDVEDDDTDLESTSGEASSDLEHLM